MRARLSGVKIRTTVSAPDAAIGPNAGTPAVWSISAGQDTVVAGRDDNADMLLYAFAKPRRTPTWVAQVSTIFPGALSPLALGEALSVVIFVRVQRPGDGPVTWIAWCFGHGYWTLRRRALEPRFGLLVALNSVLGSADAVGGLRDVQYRAYTPGFQSGTIKTSTPQSVDVMRVDRRTDQLARAGGESADDSLSGRVTGGRAVQLEFEIDGPDSLRTISATVAELSSSDAYRSTFAWIDHCVPVDDEDVEQALLEFVAAQLLAADPTYLDLLFVDEAETPEPVQVAAVLFPHERKNDGGRTVATVQALGSWLTSRVPYATPSDVLDLSIRLLDETSEVIANPPILEVLSAQFVHDGQTFILYDGDFYQVDGTYIDLVNTDVNRLEGEQLLPMLATWNGGPEALFNESVVTEYPDDYVLLDKQLIRVPGETAFEPADLINGDGCFIHVKRKDRSSTFGHLLNQARVAADALTRSEDARTALQERIAAAAGSRTLKRRVQKCIERLSKRDHGLQVKLVLLGKRSPDGPAGLPFFSKLALSQTAQQVASLGFTLTLQWVPSVADV